MKGLVKSHLEKFENLVVQLGKSVQETAVYSYFKDEDPIKLFGDHPTIETVAKSEKMKNRLDSYFEDDLAKMKLKNKLTKA